jgi:hypothetical protein
MKIIVKKVDPGWRAYLEGKPAVWGYGKSSDAAIGSMVSAHSSEFKLQVSYEYSEKKPKTLYKGGHPYSVTDGDPSSPLYDPTVKD